MRREVLLLLFLAFTNLLNAQIAYEQTEIDSFVENELNFKNLQKFRKMLETDLSLKGWSKYYSVYAYHLWRQNQNDSSRIYVDSAINNLKKSEQKYTTDEKSLLQSFLTLGYINRAEKKYISSTQYFMKALEVEKKYPYKYKSYINAGIANNHLSLGNNRKALEFYSKNLKDSVYISNPRAHVVTLTRLGYLYMPDYLDKRDSSFYYFKSAEKVSLQTGYVDNLPFIYADLGWLHKKTEIDSTIFYFKKAKKLYKNYEILQNTSPSNSDLLILANNSLVDVFENKLDSAISNLKYAINKMKITINDKMERDNLADSYDYLILAYEKKGNHLLANQYLKEKGELVNSFHETELSTKLENLQVAYETKEKEELIAQLELENQNKDLLASKQKNQFIYGLAIAAILILTIFLYFRQKTLKAQYNKIALEQRLLRSQMNPHFIFNILQSVSAMIIPSPEKAEKMIVEFGGLLRLSLENSREDFVELRDEVSALQKYLQLYANTVMPFEYSIDIDPQVKLDEVSIPPMLIQPLVENAIKHGVGKVLEEGKILVSLSKMNDKFIICQVKDNGPGFVYSLGTEKSLALQILEERLSVYNNTKKINPFTIIDKGSDPSKMTKVIIKIPFKYI